MSADKYRDVLASIEKKMSEAGGQVTALVDTAAEKDYGTAEGVSLLEVKNHLLLEYNTAVALVCLIKLEGGELEGHPVVDHLTFLRTALDKLKPVETKIKYQIDKLLRADTAEGKGKGKADPLKFKPNLGNLQAKVGDDGPADSRGRGRESDLSSGVYQPPKLAAVPFEDDDSKEARKLRRNAKEQLKMANTEIMRDLRSEYTDTPEEISHNDIGNAEFSAEIAERERLEETHFVRLGGRSKMMKKRQRLATTMSGASTFDVTKGLRSLEDGIGENKMSMREKMDEVKKHKKRQRKN